MNIPPDLRARAEELESRLAEYEAAKALVESDERTARYMAAILNFVRRYAIGDSGDKAIGLASAARALLMQFEEPRAVVERYEQAKKTFDNEMARLEEPEKR